VTFYFKLKRIFYCSWKHKELKDFLEKLKKDKK